MYDFLLLSSRSFVSLDHYSQPVLTLINFQANRHLQELEDSRRFSMKTLMHKDMADEQMLEDKRVHKNFVQHLKNKLEARLKTEQAAEELNNQLVHVQDEIKAQEVLL